MAKLNAFICGYPITHSRSPKIHNYWLAYYGIEGSYRAIYVTPENLPFFLKAITEIGFSGGNVTMPYKETAFTIVERYDEAAEQIGAVNTVWLKDGVLWGSNTDAYGFSANLDHMSPGWDNGDVAVVLGAGGASRAIIHVLKQRGFRDIRIINRTIERAKKLVHQFGDGIKAYPQSATHELLGDASLLVSTTALSMNVNDILPADPSGLPNNAVVTDIVCMPLETPLLVAARSCGLQTVNGLGMLLHQAVPGFERWFGKRPKVTTELRNMIITDLGAQI